MSTETTSALMYRVTYHRTIGVYYVEGIGCCISSHESVIRDGLTHQEATALARLLGSGERDDK